VELAPNDNPKAPLAAVLTVGTDEPARLELRLDDGSRDWVVDPRTELAVEHRVPVLGLAAGKRHRVTVMAIDAAGNRASSDPLELEAAPLPEDFPRIELVASDPGRMEPGLTLFSLMRWPEAGPDQDYGALVAVEETGTVVWYYLAGETIEDSRQLANGNFLYSAGRRNGIAREIDALGNVVRCWQARRSPLPRAQGCVEADTDSFHHETGTLPSGNLFTLSTEVRRLSDYPASDVDPTARSDSIHVVGDVLAELSPSSGGLMREWKLMDVLDPYRIGFDSLGGTYWDRIYPDEMREGLNDWAHTNGAFYDPAADAFVLSLRHQDAIVKIEASTGELVWILANHSNWSEKLQSKLLHPKGDLEWPFHQHSPEITPSGTLLVFDNGNLRASPFTGEEKMPLHESYSRAVEYQIDEEAMEAREVWRYGGKGATDERFFSLFISDVDWLSVTGNVLVTDGGRVEDGQGRPTARPGVHRWARIVEVTHETPPAKVFELEVRGVPPEGWHVYRAERIESLYRRSSSPRE
jgi:hypothetical protein